MTHSTKGDYPPWYNQYTHDEVFFMAKTKSSVRGKPEKKIVVVKPYKKKDGTSVKEHRRSTPN